MSCCDIKNEDHTKKNNFLFTCPECEDKGTKVEMVTPKTLLMDSSKIKIHESLKYKFCRNRNCKIAYFTKNNNHYFTKYELKIKATLKDQSLSVKTCYCFGHTRQSIIDEIKKTGQSTVVKDIRGKMKSLGCFCETSNPQGSCCLSNNVAWVKEAKKMCL
jgi:hypothetical protein